MRSGVQVAARTGGLPCTRVAVGTHSLRHSKPRLPGRDRHRLAGVAKLCAGPKLRPASAARVLPAQHPSAEMCAAMRAGVKRVELEQRCQVEKLLRLESMVKRSRWRN